RRSRRRVLWPPLHVWPRRRRLRRRGAGWRYRIVVIVRGGVLFIRPFVVGRGVIVVVERSGVVGRIVIVCSSGVVCSGELCGRFFRSGCVIVGRGVIC